MFYDHSHSSPDSETTYADSPNLEDKRLAEGVRDHYRRYRKHDDTNRPPAGVQSIAVSILPVFTILLALNLVISTWLFSQSRVADFRENMKGSSWFSIESSQSSETDCIRRLQSYTPAIDSIEYYDTEYDLDYSNTSRYRGPPTKDRQEAWLDLWRHEGVKVETWEMLRLNRTDLEKYERVKPEKGDGFAAWLEVHHQLACLDLVRQYTWLLTGNYPEKLIPEELQKSPQENRNHVDYCIETLRLSLMCNGDTTPILVTKERNEVTGWRSDFNVHRKCRNFTKLQDWTEAHGVEDWETPGGH